MARSLRRRAVRFDSFTFDYGRSLTVRTLVTAIGILALTSATASAQRLDTPRITPVEKADWTDAQRDLLQTREDSNQLINVVTTIANHPNLARDFEVFALHVLRRSTLPDRDREVLILRIGWLCQSEYEWSQHVVAGKSVGLTDDDIQQITNTPSAASLSEHDRLLLQATDELHRDSHISDATWAALSETYSTEQMMDLVFTVGQYTLVSMALNSFGVQLDDGFEGFPE